MRQVLILFLLSSNILATNLIFEPNLGYQMGSYKVGQSESKSAYGLGAGMRFAYFSRGLYMGGDYHYSKLSVDNMAQSPEQNQLGALVGFAFPVLPFRVWFTYIPFDSLDTADGSFEGNGYKIAMGMDPMPFLSFNLEYKKSTYDELQGAPVNDSRQISALYFNIGILFGTLI